MLNRRQFIRTHGAAGAGLVIASTTLPAWGQFRVEISGVGATQFANKTFDPKNRS